jgi:hypothetical protein
MNVIMDLTKIDDVGKRNELLGIESLFKEYVCLHFVVAQYQQKGECSILPSVNQPNPTCPSEINLPTLGSSSDVHLGM